MQVESNKLRVDLIPASAVSGGMQVLYHKEPGSPCSTNVAQHVHLIARSGRTQEICALKIWRERHALEFPSLLFGTWQSLLALEGERFGQLADNVFAVLRYLSSRFEQTMIRDPANPENIVI